MSSAQDITPQALEITLANGRKLVLQDLSAIDFRDGEKQLDRPMDQWLPTEQTKDSWPHSVMTTFCVILWLLSRKHGVTRADQIAGKWAFPLDDLLVDVTKRDVTQHAETISTFFGGDPGATQSASSPGSSPTGSPTTSS